MKFVACCALVALTALSALCPEAQEHPFSVKDDIEMVRFSDPYPLNHMASSTIAQESPDRRHFAVVTTRGLLASDLVESSITVFDRAELKAFLHGSQDAHRPEPRVVARIRSYPHREQSTAYAPVIKDVRWAADQRHLYFRGEMLNGNFRIYEASVYRFSVRAITPANQSVGSFDFIHGRIVYRASSPKTDTYDNRQWLNQDTELITGHSLEDVLLTGQLPTVNPERFAMEVLTKHGDAWERRELPSYSVREFGYLAYLFPFAISPLGDKVVAMTPTSKIPEAWTQYDPAPGFAMWRFHGHDAERTSVRSSTRPQQYSLIDLKTGKTTPLLDAPNARTLGYSANNRAVWSRDGKRVLLTNTFMGLAGPEAERLALRLPCAVASVDIADDKVRCLRFVDSDFAEHKLQVSEVSFGGDGDKALLLMEDALGKYNVDVYQLHQGAWQYVNSHAFEGLPADFVRDGPSSPQGKDPLTVSVHQSLNTPPTLWASDNSASKGKELWNPNPQLQHVRLGEASVYQWKDSTGLEWTGGLIKPVGYVPGKRYPAVIQMYNFEDGLFLTDGTDPSAFAARHLASVGFVVLQIQKKRTTVTEADVQTSLRGYRSAVESLSDAGLIDRTKVGVTGFSWTCWYAEDAITRDPTLFAAAVISDGLTNSYMEYQIIGDGNSDIRLQMEKIRGSMPYGAGLKRWVDTAAGFQMDQVKSPIRFEAMNALSVLGEWELYASLRLQNKPVDFVFFPHGTHIHQRPLERLESQQGSVDWFRFWLQGYKDPDPAKAAQYLRWEGMKSTGRSKGESRN
jgi:hypothetical protein